MRRMPSVQILYDDAIGTNAASAMHDDRGLIFEYDTASERNGILKLVSIHVATMPITQR